MESPSFLYNNSMGEQQERARLFVLRSRHGNPTEIEIMREQHANGPLTTYRPDGNRAFSAPISDPNTVVTDDDAPVASKACVLKARLTPPRETVPSQNA